MIWGQETQQNGNTINFDELFSKSNLTALKFLSTDGIVEESKRQNQKITSKLIQEKEILKNLIDIALRPNYCQQFLLQQITTDHTFKSIEILNSLSQEFTDFLFSNNQSAAKEEDEVLQQEISTQNNEFFQYLLKVLQQQKPVQQTPLSYLARLTTPFCYHKPKQIIMFLSQNHKSLQFLFNHFYSKSMFDWIIRLLETEDTNSFFQKQKIEIIKKCVQQISKETDKDLLLQKLQNYQALYENMLQKLDDRFDKSKFSSMIKQILIQKYCLDFLFQQTQEQKWQNQPQIMSRIINIFETYLKFSITNRPTNPNTSKMSNQASESSVYEIRLNTQHLNKMKQFITKNYKKFTIQSPNRNLTINYLRLIKSINNIDNQYISSILSVEFMRNIFQLLEQFSNNNILHNIIKQIIVQALNKSYKPIAEILLYGESYFPHLLDNVTNKNSKFSYQNQIYHIFQTILKKLEDGEESTKSKLKSDHFTEIISTIKEKQTFYAKLIGGNPRKQSSCWGDSSQQIILDHFFPKFQNKLEQIPSQEEKEQKEAQPIQGGNQHWFDCNLPLDSDESKDQSLGNMEKSINQNDQMKNQLVLREDSRKNTPIKLETLQEKGNEEGDEMSLEGSFMKHFDSYLSFSADDLFEQVNN